MEEKDKNRLHLSFACLQDALCYLGTYFDIENRIKNESSNNEFFVMFNSQRALTFSSIILYSSIFKRSNGDVFISRSDDVLDYINKLHEICRKNISDYDSLHKKIIGLRDTRMAHYDARNSDFSKDISRGITKCKIPSDSDMSEEEIRKFYSILEYSRNYLITLIK